jgi:hypothetical protein
VNKGYLPRWMRGLSLLPGGLQRAQTFLHKAEIRCQEARVHGAHASSTSISGSSPSVTEKRIFRLS